MNRISIGASSRTFAMAVLAPAMLYTGAALAQNITTVAGTGEPGYNGDGGPAVSANLTQPIGADIDAAGNLYIAELGAYRVRKVTPAGTISTVAGNGVYGDSGDGGPATSASIGYVYDVAVDATGNVYLADYQNSRIRRVATNGTITTIAGNGTAGYSGDGGAATSAQISYPLGIATDASGTVYFTEYGACRIRRIALDGVISTVAGTTCGYSGDNGPATSAQIGAPVSLTVDGSGNILFSEYFYNRIRRIDTAGVITTIAGTGAAGSTGDGGPATAATLNQPWGVATDASGNAYVSELQGSRVRRISPSGLISTIAGTGVAGYNGDNQPATSAQLTYPAGLAVGAGALYVADYAGQRVRRVSLFSTCAAEGFTGAKLTLCRKVCEVPQAPSTLSSLIRLYTAAYREEPPCAR
jgi:sugar lactone lactonase YvrE